MEIYFGKNINFLRNKAGLTQDALGKVFGLGDTAIQGWEKSNSYPHFKILVAVREYFGVDLERIVFHDLSNDKPDILMEDSKRYGLEQDERAQELKREIDALREMIDAMRGSVKKIDIQDARIALLERQLELLLSEKKM